MVQLKHIVILLVFLPNLLFAEVDLKYTPQFVRTASVIDPELKEDAAIYEFQFSGQEIELLEANVYYSIDGANERQHSQKGKITVKTTAGKHIFQFFYNDQYEEVYSDSLMIEAGHRDTYTVALKSGEEIYQVFKPVIYLYPRVSTEVEVKIDIRGEDAFLYPNYDNSWNFTADPNGDLQFGEETYNYLFWESTQRTVLSPPQTASGFFVEGQNATEFLENKLTKAGFNSKEQADFITFWGPRLAQNDLNFVHFEFNETCNKYAELDISPKPDHIYRIFMTWGAVSEEFEVKEQEMKAIDRNGFSVLEWGGKEMHIEQSFVNKHIEL